MSTIAIIILAAIILTATSALVWALLQDAFIKVAPGEMGLVITRGKPADHGLPPGVHFALRFGRVIEVYPAVEITYLTVPAGATVATPQDALTMTDPPLRAVLGDRTAVTLQYTVRFRVAGEGLPTIHRRFGQTGIKSIIRDESRRILIAALGEASVSAADAIGARQAALEDRVRERLGPALTELGFTLTMFNLREVDLAETGEVIQSALRASEELARERAAGAVRMLRAEQEAAINATLAGSLSPSTLEYLRLQATRELIERWDGKLLAPLGLPSLMDGPDAPSPRGAEVPPAPTPPTPGDQAQS